MKNTPIEWSIIDRINYRVRRENPHVVVPLGDDAFVFKNFPGYSVLCQDMLVEDVHFSLEYFSPEDLGHKALAINLSDIAAMGATPHFAQVSLAIPEKIKGSWLDDFYIGMSQLADSYSCQIVGGDLCASPSHLVIDVSVHGSCTNPLTRQGVKAGDFILCQGHLGLSQTGLLALQNKIIGFDSAKQRHLRPIPRLDLAPDLQKNAKNVHALIDCSDGLVNDLLRICPQNLGVHIFSDKVPLHQESIELAFSLGIDPRDLALWGGEDFELIVAIDPKDYNSFSNWQLIGHFTEAPGFYLIEPNHAREIKEFKGWQHFKNFSK